MGFIKWTVVQTLTLGAGGCVGKMWSHHNCAAYRWRGAAGMWAGGEMPALLMACLPKTTRQTTRHFTETDYWYAQWLNLKHVRLSHKQYMKQTDSVNRDCRWIFNKFKRLFTPVNILWKAFHVHNCKLLIFSPSSDLFFPPLENIQYSLSWEFSVPAYYLTFGCVMTGCVLRRGFRGPALVCGVLILGDT